MSILKVDQLEVSYESSYVIRNLNLELEKGKVTTIIGPNGCGKSTLLKTMGRIIKQKHGTVFFKGKDLTSLNTKKVAQELAILSQSPLTPAELTVEALVAYGRYPYRKNLKELNAKDQKIIEWAMEVTQTIEFRHRALGSLSGGQRQKVWIAMAMAQETEILLLDEPTTYLDMAHQLEVLELIHYLNKKQNRTIVMVLHDINQAARFSDVMIAMKQGEIKKIGPPQEIITKPVLKEVFNIEARIMEDPIDQIPVCISYEKVNERVN